MEKLPKIKIAKSAGKIALVLFVCFLFFQMGKISVTNAILRDEARAKNNSFVAGTWGDSLGLRSADAVIEEAVELGILGEESLEQERALNVSLENDEPIVEAPDAPEDSPESGEAPISLEDVGADAQSIGAGESLPEESEPEIIPLLEE